MATIKDVARMAGVSVGTVSNVLNGRECVKAASRENVYKAIKELGFRYNMTASALRTKATKTIALIIPTIVNPYYPELARGVEDTVQKAGCTLFLCNSDRDADKERQYIDVLLSRGTDGLILVKTNLSDDELTELSKKTALVLVDYEGSTDHPFRVVNVNDTAGVIQGMSLLWKKHHRRIAFISGSLDSYSSQCRTKAYQSCLEQWGIPYRSEYLVMGDYSWNSGYEAALQLLSLKEPPTAIFAANDVMAIGAVKAAAAKGIDVPGELSVIGYDDIEISNLCMPALTTIYQPKYQVGAEAAGLLIHVMGKNEVREQRLLLETHLVERESVAEAEK